MSQTIYTTDQKEFYNKLLDDKLATQNLEFVSEEMAEITYQNNNNFIDGSNITNIFMAAFTTSHARLYLYNLLDRLGDRVLGYDTDSVWYVDRGDGVYIETGANLGDVTDELNGDYIVNWCGSGPKSYSFITNSGKIVCKVKGFSLNAKNSQYLNKDTMREIIEGTKSRITLVNEHMINRKNRQVVNIYHEKDFHLCYDKRLVTKRDNCIDTLPYGF